MMQIEKSSEPFSGRPGSCEHSFANQCQGSEYFVVPFSLIPAGHRISHSVFGKKLLNAKMNKAFFPNTLKNSVNHPRIFFISIQ